MLNRLSLTTSVFILIFIIKASYGHFDDPDFYWHIKTGGYLLGQWPLARAEVFSFPNAGHPWVLSEWGAEILLYGVFALWGALGINMLVALLYTVTCYLMFLMVKRVWPGNESKALIVTLLCGALFAGVAPRPYLFTYLFFALILYRLVVFKYCRETSHLWVLPGVMFVWANMHGGYFIGIVLLCLFLATEWFGGAKLLGDERQSLVRLSVATGLAVMATLINPEFIKLWWYPLQTLGMDVSTELIEEWRSPDFHQLLPKYFLAIVAGTVGGALYGGKRPDLTEYAIPAFFVVCALLSRRNIPLAAIALTPFLAMQLNAMGMRLLEAASEPGPRMGISRKLKQWCLSSAHSSDISPKSESIVNALLIVLTLIALLILQPVRQKQMDAQMNQTIPVKAVDFLLREHIQGRMFNTYHYGGYLIYRLYPAQKVFIYGRTDMMSSTFLQTFFAVYGGQIDWKAYFNRYGIDYVVCESAAPIRQLLLEGSTFKLVFDDGMHSVLLRDTDHFKSIIKKYAGSPAHE